MAAFNWMRAKQRANAIHRRRGQAAPNARLTEAQVRLLRSRPCNLHDLSRRWRIDRKTLRDARDCRTWSHVHVELTAPCGQSPIHGEAV